VSELTLEKIAKSGTEEAEQTALFAWAALAKNSYPELELLFAIPNGGKRDKGTGAKLSTGSKNRSTRLVFPSAVIVFSRVMDRAKSWRKQAIARSRGMVCAIENSRIRLLCGILLASGSGSPERLD